MDQELGNPTRTGPIGLGVVGVSRAWAERYRAAVERRRDALRVVAIHDAVAARSLAEATRWRAASVDGIRALMARPDVEAILIFVEGWTGEVPARFAAEASKPHATVRDPDADPDTVLERLVSEARAGARANAPDP